MRGALQKSRGKNSGEKKQMSFLSGCMELAGKWLRIVNRREVRARITCDKCNGSNIVHALVFDDNELDAVIREKGWEISSDGTKHYCYLCKEDK